MRFAVLALLALAPVLTSAAERGSASDEGCVVPVYTPSDSDEYVFRPRSWIFGQLVDGLPDACDCHLELRDLTGVPGASDSELARSVVIQPQWHHTFDEVSRRLADLPLAVAQTVGLFHQGDESGGSGSRTQRLAWVYRDHYRAGIDRIDHLLADVPLPGEASAGEREPVGAGENVFWVPMGHGSDFLRAAALRRPLSSRKLVWFWAGDAEVQPHYGQDELGLLAPAMERQAMLAALHAHPRAQQLLSPPCGYLRAYNSSEQGAGSSSSTGRSEQHARLPAAAYSQMLYEARFVPCPAGGGKETHRLWEALEAGAIPIVSTQSWEEASFLHQRHSAAPPKKQHDSLQHLDLLHLPVLKVDDWSELPDLLLDLEAMPERDLDRWQGELQAGYAELKRRAQAHVAASVCGIARGTARPGAAAAVA